MPRFYAAKNAYGSPTNVGFDNAWSVYAFRNRRTRDEWVAKRYPRNMSAQAVKRSEIGQYIGRPKPFSGEAFVINATYAQESRESAYGLVSVEVPCRASERVYSTL